MNIGISVDTSYFPEINDERSNYISRLTPILMELRRKHVVAAAASAGPQLSDDSWSGDDVTEDDDKDIVDIFTSSLICSCYSQGSRKTLLRKSSFFDRKDLLLSSGRPSNADLCLICGKRKVFDPIGEISSGRGPSSAARPRSNTLEQGALRGTHASAVPEHTQALLQSTPQLRRLSPASTDMQGSGNLNSSRGILGILLPGSTGSSNGSGGGDSTSTASLGAVTDYRVALARDKANQHAAAELASFMWVLAHEMSLDNYGYVENDVFTSIFSLIQATDTSSKMAGVAALDALIEAPSADEEKKAIKFANNLSSSLRSPNGDYEFLSVVSKSLGHMAVRATNVDFVESEITRALEWLRSDRSQRRLAACLTLKELAIHAPTAFYAKTSTSGYGGSNEFLDQISSVLSDPQPIVRACAADALSQCLKILVDRRHASLTAFLCQIHFSVMAGLKQHSPKNKSAKVLMETEQANHGFLLTVACMIHYTRDFMLPRFDEICEAVLAFTEHPKALIRLEVVRLIPRLGRRCPSVFGRRYLEVGLHFLMKSASNPTPGRVGIDIRPSAFAALGQLVLAMNDPETGRLIGGSPSPTVKILNTKGPDLKVASVIIETSKTGVIYENLAEIFALVRSGLRRARPNSSSRDGGSDIRTPALYCASDLVAALEGMAEPFLSGLINDMFGSGLSEELIHCLHSISASMPSQQAEIEDRMLQEISMCLAGTASADKICDPLAFFGQGFFGSELVPWNIARQGNSHRGDGRTVYINFRDNGVDRKSALSGAEVATETAQVQINMSEDPYVIMNLDLCLRTLGSFGENSGRVKIKANLVPILPFVRDVVSHYLVHPSSEVRRAAAITCCALLIPREIPEAGKFEGSPWQLDAVHASRKRCLGTHSGRVVEEVLTKLIQVAVSDPSPVLRLCVVRALDERYDYFLCQAHHIQPLFFLLQDEALVTRAAGLQLLGRLTRLNPAPILPVMRKVLRDLIVELRCGRSREEAIRLLIVFLRAEPLHRLVQPVLATVVEALPLKGVAPRLASASLEALGELARASGYAFKPWVKDIIPQIMETMQDQSSASKQRISLRTLGQIAGSTGYVVRPYLDYPQLLPQATDVLPGTKRAPWELRREVIRTLGIVGALDPDQYHTFADKTRKGGAVGGGYFAERGSESVTELQASSDPAPAASKIDEELDASSKSSMALVTTMPPVASEFGDHVKDVDDDMPVHLYMYEQYAMVAQPVSKMVPPQRMTPAAEDFYPTVAIQALTRIFKDPSLAVHHGMVMQAIMFIFNSLGQKCVPFLGKVVPHILYTIRTCSASNLREALLKQVASLSVIVNEHLRPYVAEIFDIVDELWETRHLGTILTSVTMIAAGVPDDFRKFVPRLVRKLLSSLDDVQTSDWFKPSGRKGVSDSASLEFDKLELILRSLKSLRGVLGDYLHVLVTSLLKLADALITASSSADTDEHNRAAFTKASIETLKTISHLLEHDSVRPSTEMPAASWRDLNTDSLPTGCSLPARATQPLIRLLSQTPPPSRNVGLAIIESLCVCARQLGRQRWVPLYNDAVRNVITTWQIRIGLQGGDVTAVEQPGRLQQAGLRLYDEVITEIETSNSDRLDFNFRPNIRDLRRDSMFEPKPSEEFTGEILPVGSILDNNPDQSQQDIGNASIQPMLNRASRHRVNQTALALAWDVSQKATRDDWTEWMRRFAIQLLWEAPSPALRATASLAHAYQPLARELFSAAFVCCWEELTEQYRRDLVQALETAFVADVSPEILQTLLNLAEFMEHDGVGTGLPIDISNLAELALKCRSYAKALHYKEREYNQGGNRTGSCVEALISINKKLDLPEAALGVLKTSQLQMDPAHSERLYSNSLGSFSDHITSQFLRNNFRDELKYGVMAITNLPQGDFNGGIGISEIRESWLSKLGSWSEALQIYEQKLRRNPQDFDAILGSMRCLDASGEWQKVLDLAEQGWSAISGGKVRVNDNLFDLHIPPKGRRKFFKFGAQAAWRLADWDVLEKYASALVHGTFGDSKNTSVVSQVSPSNGVPPGVDFDGCFFTAVIHIHRKQWTHAAKAIDAARQAMDGRFTALMAESYKRAYYGMISAMILAEMEEIIAYRKLEGREIANSHRHPTNRPNAEEARTRLLSVWRDRLAGCRVDAAVHSQIMGVRSLVLGPTDEVQATLMLSDLSKQAQMFKLAERVLLDPLTKLGANLNGPVFGFGLPAELGAHIFSIARTESLSIDRLVTAPPRDFLPSYDGVHEQFCRQIVQEAGGLERLQIQHKLYFAYVKHLWSMDQRDKAIHRLERLCDIVDIVAFCEKQTDRSISVACWLEYHYCKIEDRASPNSPMSSSLQVSVLFALKRAISCPSCGYRAWHRWALLNFRLAEQLQQQEEGSTTRHRNQTKSLGNHIVAAAQGFAHAISLGTKRWSASVQQDMLNLLTCLFKYGELPDVAKTIKSGMQIITLETWLGVLPQLLARIHIRKPSVRSVLHPLLTDLGEKHPQALMYPLSVLLKSPVAERKSAAESLMNSLQAHSSSLVEEALMVSSELIRVAILWLEMWHEGLEDASRLHFGEGNVSGMLDLLLPLHEKLENGAETQKENEFVKSFGSDLAEAHNFVKEYIRIVTSDGGSIPTQGGGSDQAIQYDQSGNPARQQSKEAETAINKAWDIYYQVFRWINKQLPALTKLELHQCSPALRNARSLELGVPGSYRVDGSYVKIEQFIPSVQVIPSKQRPRKIVLRGSDGRDYVFLLKGHEDLRQDERVMQLFGLVNALLARDRRTKKHDLNIQRYAISPLSHNCGVVGWVPHCETLHSMIRDYRASKKIPLNMENREMLKIAPDYDLLSVMEKVEVFTDALQRATGRGNDLYEILWLKSTNSEEWLERRTRFTRSLAVMSIVGYILGLGDRHPSNLMLDQLSGRVLHIDFGDCFEVAMHRERYPEKVPFRLTRMLVQAMEVSGIEGSYRSTCERTMSVLRQSRDSLLAMLEAFVYDPLISWRLVALSEVETAHAAVTAPEIGGRPPCNPSTLAIVESDSEDNAEGAPIDVSKSLFHEAIEEGYDEDDGDDEEPGARAPLILTGATSLSERIHAGNALDAAVSESHDTAAGAAKSRSLQMYSSIQALAANLSTSSRIASISGEGTEPQAAEGSTAKSRIARSLRQREVMSLLEGQEGNANEEALNEKALKVIRLVQDKLSGTDLDETTLDVPDQVQRLIVQATSSENLCQLFIGWCAFW